MLRTLRFAVAGAVFAALGYSGLISIVRSSASGFAQAPAAGGDAGGMSNRCAARAFDGTSGPMWNGWGRDLNNSRYQPDPGFTADQLSRMKLKWAFGFPNAVSAWGQPTVVGGRVFVGVDTGDVYAVDAATGCLYWSHKAQAGVRSAVSIGRITAAGVTRYAAYFGDLVANVYAVDAESGAVLWTKRADTHVRARITGAPAFYEGRVYVPVSSLEEGSGAGPQYECCTFRGSVVVYDAANGEQIWKSETITTPLTKTRKTSLGTQMWGPAGAAIWSSPTIDPRRGVLYVATGDAYTSPAAGESDAVVAMDLKTGRHVWVRQVTPNDAFLTGSCPSTGPGRSETCPDPQGPDFDFGNSPVLRTLSNGRSVIAIGQKSGIGWGLDPDNKGAILWQHRVGKGSTSGGIQWGSAADDQLAYFANADSRYGPAEAGGLAAVRLDTGERVWFVRPPPLTTPCPTADDRRCVQAQSAAVTVIPGAVFSGATNGIMRAYSTTDGKVLWEYDTAHAFTTVNGVEAKGGAINGPGPTAAGGTLFMTSGYAGLSGRGAGAGNVLLAFRPE
jgi:polyvinyl alcohol dehydrogenase (cytochrome)